MISVPSGIQPQLGEAVSAIADSDFWERWDTLVDVSLFLPTLPPVGGDGYFLTGYTFKDLVSRLQPTNPAVNIGVLQVAHSIFKRWRPLFRSDALYTEINHVLERFGTPFLALFEVCQPIMRN